MANLFEIEETDGVMEEMDRWMFWYTQVVRHALPQPMLEAIKLPVHVTDDLINELTARRLDNLPTALKEAADIAENEGF